MERRASSGKQSKISFDKVFHEDGLILSLVRFFLTEEECVSFGSLQVRLSIVLLNKTFAQVVGRMAARALQVKYNCSCGPEWVKKPFKTGTILCHLPRSSILPQAPLRSVTHLTLRQSSINFTQIQALSDMCKTLQCLVLDRCSFKVFPNGWFLQLMDARTTEKDALPSAFIEHVLHPLQLVELEIISPDIDWDMSFDHSSDRTSTRAIPIKPDVSELNGKLTIYFSASNNMMGRFCHWYSYMSEMEIIGKRSRLEFVFEHETCQDILHHHQLLPIPTYLDQRFFAYSGLPHPDMPEDEPDIHDVIWRYLEENQDVDAVLIHKIKSSNCTITQRKYNEKYSVEVEPVEFATELSQMLLQVEKVKYVSLDQFM